MIDIIESALIWIMGNILDRRPQGGEAFRMFLLVILAGLAVWLSFYWRNLLLRLPSVREYLLPEDRYAGRYLQAVSRPDEDDARYSILDIYYNVPRQRFEAAGRSYNHNGEQISSFKSEYVTLPSEDNGNIEFVWKGNRSAGHTLMRVDLEDGDYVEGGGRIQTFGRKPDIFPILFKYLHDRHVRDVLDADPPRNAAQEPVFIRKLHARLGKDVKQGLASVAEKV